MSIPFARMTFAAAAIALAPAAIAFVSPSASAQDGSGRFTMAPVEDGGFVRLDKETGAMSMCRPEGDAWACVPMGDDQSMADEVERLRQENAELRDEIQRLEDTFVGRGDAPPDGGPGKRDRSAGGPPGGLPPGGMPPGGLPDFKLPSEEEVDRAVDYLEGMIRKFRERFEDFGDKTDPDRPRHRPEADPDPGPRDRSDGNGEADREPAPTTTPL